MNRLSIFLLLMLWVQSGLSQERTDEQAIQRSNTLFIYTDDQSHRTVGCYPESFDWVRTPNTTELAAQGIQKEGDQNAWIIDTHTHFKGVEQIELESKEHKRNPKDTLGQVIVPADYRAVADRTDIQSTMVVEAVDQDQPQFNDWLLEQAKSDLVCGYVARGDLTSDNFPKNYQRYRESGYLKGYRFRNDELHGYLDSRKALEHLKTLEQDGMVVDLLVDHRHSGDVIQLAQQFPRLKIVINHCFRVKTENGRLTDKWKAAVSSCAKHPNVFMKLSSIVDFAGTKPFVEQAPSESEVYQSVLEFCFNSFGEDRVIFGTNWGVCTHYGKVDDVVRVVADFLKSKSDVALQKGMRDNAIRVYEISKKHLR